MRWRVPQKPVNIIMMKKQFPTLYSRTATGAVQIWTIIVDGDSYYTMHGQQGGAIQTTLPTVAVPTNEGRANYRDGEAQALFEAQAAFDKKKKSGGYFEHIDNIDEESFVEPMLAKKFVDRKDKVKYPCISQTKYNGSRCIATRYGLFSRKGERWVSTPHIEESLKDFFTKWPQAVLDGELMGEGFKANLNETMKLIRKTVKISPQDLKDSEAKVRYFVYDGYGFEGITQKSIYTDRAKAIKKALSGNPYYREVESVICNNEEEVMAHFGTLVGNGEEGSIIRIIDAPYENKRSSQLLKLKESDDSEGVILDITPGVGNWAGTGKRITLKWKGQVFDASFKGTYDQAKAFLENKDQWIGKTVTFLYNGLTGLGTPNFARIDFNNCLK